MNNLVNENIIKQKASLLATLDNVINGFEDLETELITIGQRHKNLGIKKNV